MLTHFKRGSSAAVLLLLLCPALSAFGAHGPSGARHRNAQRLTRRKPGAVVRRARSHVVADATGVLLGNTTVEWQYDSLPAGEAEAFRLQATSSGVTTAVHIYVSVKNAAGTVVAGLYGQVAGRPVTLLTKGSTSLSKPGTWTTVPVAPVALVAGRIYWLAILGRGGTLRYRDRASGPCLSETSARRHLRALPASWRAGTTYSDCPVSAYVTEASLPPAGGSPLKEAPVLPAKPVAPLPPAPPASTALPTISGIPTEGQVLVVSNGTWTESPTSYTYQWQDCKGSGNNCASISGASSGSYTIQAGDGGDTLRAVVTATNLGGSASASSAQTAVVTAGTVPNPGNGLSTSPAFFPIGVWLQTATSRAQTYADIGVNTFVGQWEGNTSAALQALQETGEIVISQQDFLGLNAPNNEVIKAWQSLPDEPDNAQPDGKGGYGPCVDPSTIIAEYNQVKAADPSRPVYLNFGQGVANTSYVGRGSCAGKTAMYSQYTQGADIVSFDVYPVNDGYPLSIIATGVDNLRAWAGDKPLFAFIETTPQSGGPGPTPAQIQAETWLALIHGANGIEYFCHILSPTFIEAGCLTLPTVVAQMKADDAQIASLAPVLNSNTIPDSLIVNDAFRVDTMEKSYGGALYVFAEAVDANGGSASFSLPGAGNETATVLGENRTIKMSGGSFTDSFGGYGVHLYRITTTAG